MNSYELQSVLWIVGNSRDPLIDGHGALHKDCIMASTKVFRFIRNIDGSSTLGITST